jgi:hypothetical protein
MGRPKKAPADILEPVGSRISKPLLAAIQDAMQELALDGLIDRETISATVAWLLARGIRGLHQDRDHILRLLLDLWPYLTERDHLILEHLAADLVRTHEIEAASEPASAPEGQAGPALPDHNPKKDNGKRGEDSGDDQPRPLRIASG